MRYLLSLLMLLPFLVEAADQKPLVINPTTGKQEQLQPGNYITLPNSAGVLVRFVVGTSTPEGAVTAGVGSMFYRTDGGAATTLYVKESGAGNTGWVAIGGSSGITGTLVSGRVPYANGVSSLTDSAKMVYSDTTGFNINLASGGGTNNLMLGTGAGDGVTSASRVSAFGVDALGAGTTGVSDATAFGYQALLLNTGVENTAFGSTALNANTTGIGQTAFGFNALGAATGSYNTAIGTDAGSGISNGTNNTVVGSGAGGAITSGAGNTIIGTNSNVGSGLSSNTVIGEGASITGASGAECIALGRNADYSGGDGAGQFIVGGDTYEILDVWIGEGVSNGTPQPVSIGNTRALGSNLAGANLTIRAGAGTGTGVGGSLILSTATSVASGSGTGTQTPRVTIASDGGVSWTGIATASAPAVSATDAGRIFFDSTADRFQISENGGAYSALPIGALYAKVSASATVAISGGGTATINRMHYVTGAGGDLTFPAAASGDVLGFTVGPFSAAANTYRMDAGAAVGICGRTRYLTLVNTNVAYVLYDGTRWVPLVLSLDSPWVDGGAIGLAAVSGGLVKGTTSIDKVYWRRTGSSCEVRYTYLQTAVGSAAAGSGDYLFTIPIGTFDSTVAPADTTAFTDPIRCGAVLGSFRCRSSGDSAPVAFSAIPYDTTQFRLTNDNVAVTSTNRNVNNAATQYRGYVTIPLTDW